MPLTYEALWLPPRSPLTRRRLSALLRRHGQRASDFEISEHPRSGFNRLFALEADGGSWLAKQNLRPPGAESWFYGNLAERFGRTPRWLIADSEADVVVMEYLRGATTLEELALASPSTVFDRLLELAPVVARLHSLAAAVPGAPRAQTPFPELAPIDVRFWETSTPPARQVLEYVQGRPELVRALRQAQAGEGPQGFIHGDLKLDNILSAKERLVLVDWGCCGVGAVGWDLGGLIGSMIILWVDRWSSILGAARAQAVERREIGIDDVFRAARSFAEVYFEHLFDARLAPPEAITLAAYTAAWITGRSWVEALYSHHFAAHLRIRLAVAEAIAEEPARLLGSSQW